MTLPSTNPPIKCLSPVQVPLACVRAEDKARRAWDAWDMQSCDLHYLVGAALRRSAAARRPLRASGELML